MSSFDAEVFDESGITVTLALSSDGVGMYLVGKNIGVGWAPEGENPLISIMEDLTFEQIIRLGESIAETARGYLAGEFRS